jgi:hypothetical protein
MSAHLAHYEPGMMPEDIALLIRDHERTAPQTKRDLWHTHLRATPGCSYEQWHARPGVTMYDHITSHLRMMTRLHLSNMGRALDLAGATVSLDKARLSLASLMAYETLMRTHPPAALLELRKGELGKIGHEDIFAHLTQKSGSTLQEYVARVCGQY